MTAVPILEVRQLQKRFGGFTALDGIDLTVHAGERLGLIGPNGSGKSTFTNCLCGTFPGDGGSIHFRGKDLNGVPAHQRTRLGLGRSFQLPRPFRSLSLIDNLRVPLIYTVNARGEEPISSSEMTGRAQELLGQFGLGAKGNQLPRDLTQVEMRKLELARAMATRPRLLIADEAMAGLSSSECDEILRLLMELNREGVAIIFIEHIMRVVMAFSERLAVLVAGRKIADGPPREVIANAQVVGAYLGE